MTGETEKFNKFLAPTMDDVPKGPHLVVLSYTTLPQRDADIDQSSRLGNAERHCFTNADDYIEFVEHCKSHGVYMIRYLVDECGNNSPPMDLETYYGKHKTCGKCGSKVANHGPCTVANDKPFGI
jgi:hypothetical protein